MKWRLGLILLAASLWSSLGWKLLCSDKEYPLTNKKCCAKCPAGEGLKDRCTGTSPTVCEPCDENYYNDVYTEWRCKPCKECDAGKGLREIRACQRTSDTVCTCLPGYAREDRGSEDQDCKPCPSGFFSPGGSEECHPWTNCTAHGWPTLQYGKRDADTICDKRSTIIPPRATVTPPTPKMTGSFTMTKQDLCTSIVPRNPGSVWMLIIAVLLLAVAGALVFLIIHCRTKRKKLDLLCNEIYPAPCKEENDCRMPIQEQEAGDKSSFVQG